MIEIDKKNINVLHEFLYSIEGHKEIPLGEVGDLNHHGLVRDMKVDLDYIKENWNLENAKLSSGGNITPLIDKNKLNDSIADGCMNLRIISSFICYFFYHFLNDYYSRDKDYSSLQELENLFKYFKLEKDIKPPVLEIENLINYILKRHINFIKGLKTKINQGNNNVVKEKHDFLSSISANIDAGLYLEFLIPDQKNEFRSLFVNEVILESAQNETQDLNLEKTVLSSDTHIGLENRKSEFPTYYEKLRKRFGQIRLEAVGFEMSIDHFVKTPLYKKDIGLKKLFDDLKIQKNHLETLDPVPEEQIKGLNDRIDSIWKVLNKEHDIIDIIESGKDIFIEAPAGSGKSTMLRWLIYQFAIESGTYFPIFIELMYNTDNNLLALLHEGCDQEEYKRELAQGKKVQLYLDGFDQFNGDRLKLFRDIAILKQNNVQIIFSGREVPNTTRFNFDLVIYNLESFKETDIKKVCLTYLGIEQGTYYVDYFTSRNLLRFIDKPLYLCFVLSHIKRLIERSWERTEIISVLNVANKGRLLKDVIIDFFIGKYEEEITNHSNNQEWLLEKEAQLRALSFLALTMTFDLKDTETVQWKRAKKIIGIYFTLNPEEEKIQPTIILKESIRHNILCLNKDVLSFDRKELRLFFTSLSLKKQIKTFKDLKNKEHLFIKNGGSNNTWNAIKQYLIGILNPELLLDSFEKINFKGYVFMDSIFLEQLELSLEFAHQDNLPKKKNHITKEYLVKVINLMIEKFEDVKSHNKEFVSTIFSPIPIWRFLIKRELFPKNFIKKETEIRFNEHFFRHIYCIYLPGHHHKILKYFIYYDLGLNFKQVLKITKKLRDDEFGHKSFFYNEVLRQKETAIRLNPTEKSEIVFDYLFRFDTSNDYSELFKYNSTRLKLFTEEVKEEHSGDFINILFERIDSIPLFTLSKFIYHIFIHPKNGYFLKFESNILLHQNADRIFSYFKNTFSRKDKFHLTIERVLIKSSNTYLKGLFLDYFMEVLSEKSFDNVERINAFRYLFMANRTKDIKFLLGSIREKNNSILEIVVSFFSNIKTEYFVQREEPKDENLINFYCEVLVSDLCDYNCTYSILCITNHNNERLDGIALDILQSTSSIKAVLDYFVKFKTVKAIPIIKKYLNGYYGLHCFYTLTKLNPKFYEKYIHLYETEYQQVISFLEELNEFTDDIHQITQIFDMLYVGDKKTLKLYQSKRYAFEKKKEKNIFFYQAIEKSLIQKCKELNRYKEKPST